MSASPYHCVSPSVLLSQFSKEQTWRSLSCSLRKMRQRLGDCSDEKRRTVRTGGRGLDKGSYGLGRTD